MTAVEAQKSELKSNGIKWTFKSNDIKRMIKSNRKHYLHLHYLDDEDNENDEDRLHHLHLRVWSYLRPNRGEER